MSETGAAGIIGEQPIVYVTERTEEQAKYESMWARKEYRTVAPGEDAAAIFLQQAAPKRGSTVIDFGAGTGRGAAFLAHAGQLNVRMVDFAGNCLDEEVKQMELYGTDQLNFVQHDLTKPLTFNAQYGYCTDVMEHIPPEQVDLVLTNILQGAQHVFFQISCVDDSCGKMIGETLHLSVHDYTWWHKKLQQFGCTFHWSENYVESCCFYVTAWSTGDDVAKAGVLNTTEEEVRNNVRTNIRNGWQQATPHLANDVELMIIGGGPSLAREIDTIKRLRSEGVGTVTLNGAYNWCIENGLAPGAQIVVDAREFNSRFTRPIIDGCKYLIASQCHPKTFEGLPPDRTFMWHTTAEFIRDILDEEIDQWYGTPGGNTVLLRSIPLLRMLGFRRFHLIGCDSCLEASAHHAYVQEENNDQLVVPVTCAGKMFYCHPWMLAQAQSFAELIRYFGDTFELKVYGDGLLSWMIEQGGAVDLAE